MNRDQIAERDALIARAESAEKDAAQYHLWRESTASKSATNKE